MKTIKDIQEHYNKILNFKYDSLDDIILSIKDDLKYIASKEQKKEAYNFIYEENISDKDFINKFMQFTIDNIFREWDERGEILDTLKNIPKENLKNNNNGIKKYLFYDYLDIQNKKSIEYILFNNAEYKTLTDEEADIFFIQYKAFFTILTYLNIEMIYLYIDNSEILKNLFSIDNFIYLTFYKDEERKAVNIDEPVAFIKIYDFTLEENKKSDYKYLIYDYILSYRYFLLNAFLYIYDEDTPPDYFKDTSKAILNIIKDKQKRPIIKTKNNKVITSDNSEIDIYNDTIDYIILEHFNFLKSDNNIIDFFNLFIDLFTYTQNKARNQEDNFLKKNKKTSKKKELQTIPQTEIIKVNDITNYNILSFNLYNENYNLTNKEDRFFTKSIYKQAKFIKDNKDIKDLYNKYKQGEKAKNKIDKFKKDNKDFNLSDNDIIGILNEKGEELNLFNYLGIYEKTKSDGFAFIDIKDGQVKKTYINYTSENYINTYDLADSEIMKNYGTNTLKLKKAIDNIIINYFRENDPSTIFNKPLLFSPQAYNDKIGRTKRTSATAEELEKTISLLKNITITIKNGGKRNDGGILNITNKEIDKNKKIAEPLKDDIKKLTNEPFIKYSIIDTYGLNKDPIINKKTFYINFSPTYLKYMQLVYYKNFYQLDNTNPIPSIKNKPNDLTPTRAEAIKDYLILQMKINGKKYTDYLGTYKIKDLIKILEERNLINYSKIEKNGFKKTIIDPLFKALKHLKDNKIIDYYTDKEIIFNGKATKEKQEYFKNNDISITILNEKD